MNTFIYLPPIKISSISNEGTTIFSSTNLSILLNLKKRTNISLNNVFQRLEEGDIVVVNTNELCTVLKSDSLLLNFTIEKSLLNLSTEDKNLYFECNSIDFKNKDLFSNLRTLIGNAVKQKNLTQAKAYAIAYEIYDDLVRNFVSVSASVKSKNSKISEIISYIEKNYSENLLLNEIAEHFGLSVPYLSKFFKDSIGKTFADFYDELRINHSMYDLTETTETIIDIAYKHGFPNNHAYIRAFKKVFGTLPNEARKSSKTDKIQTVDDDNQFNEIIDILGVDTTSPSEYEDHYIYSDFNAKYKLHLESNPSEQILGIGAATSVLHKNIQSIINQIQAAYPFRYAYIRGIFSDSLSFCTRDYNGQLHFKYSMIDEVLDFLLSANLMPVLSFTYIPKVLTKEKDVAFQDGYYICEPARLDEWQQLVTNFLNHVISRYGFNVISKWIFLPWVQLDSKNRHLGFDDELSFFLFYKTSYCAVKDISKDLIVSSPEIYPSLDTEYLGNYLKWTKANNCFPDLLAIKFFHNSNWKVIEVKDNRDMAYREIVDNEISPDENLMNTALTNMKKFLNENGYNLDIYVTAFNYTITDSHPVLDTMFSANYYLKNYNDNLGLLKSLCYWKLSDDDTNPDSQLFSGSTGMYLKNGIPKGSAQSLRFLSYIQPYILERGDGYILSTPKEQSDYYRLLLYNYEHPIAVKSKQLSEPDFDPYSLFLKKKKKTIHFKISNLPFTKATFKMFIMNSEYGSPYNKWVSMGKPPLDYYADSISVLFDIIKSSVTPNFKMFNVPIINGTLEMDFKLEFFEINTIEIILSE